MRRIVLFIALPLLAGLMAACGGSGDVAVPKVESGPAKAEVKAAERPGKHDVMIPANEVFLTYLRSDELGAEKEWGRGKVVLLTKCHVVSITKEGGSFVCGVTNVASGEATTFCTIFPGAEDDFLKVKVGDASYHAKIKGRLVGSERSGGSRVIVKFKDCVLVD